MYTPCLGKKVGVWVRREGVSTLPIAIPQVNPNRNKVAHVPNRGLDTHAEFDNAGVCLMYLMYKLNQ